MIYLGMLKSSDHYRPEALPERNPGNNPGNNAEN